MPPCPQHPLSLLWGDEVPGHGASKGPCVHGVRGPGRVAEQWQAAGGWGKVESEGRLCAGQAVRDGGGGGWNLVLWKLMVQVKGPGE